MARSRITPVRRPARVLAAISAVSVVTVGLIACGGSGSGTSTNNHQANTRPSAFSDPKVQACLKKQGVEVPNFPGGNGRPPNGGNGQPPPGTDGQPPTGTDGQPPPGTDGQPPSGQRPPNGGAFNSAQAQKLRQALKKCGVTLPERGQNGPPQQQGTTPSDTTAS